MASPDVFAAFTDALLMAGSASRKYPRRRFRGGREHPTLALMQVLLRYRWGHDGARQQKIVRAPSRDKATATALLDNLVRRDFMARRSNRVVLRPKGHALAQQGKPLVQEPFEVAGQGLAPDQVRPSLAMLIKTT